MTTTTVNVNECAPAVTPGSFNCRAFYTETDAGHLFGPFASREAAERCAQILAGRASVIKVTIEEAV